MIASTNTCAGRSRLGADRETALRGFKKNYPEEIGAALDKIGANIW